MHGMFFFFQWILFLPFVHHKDVYFICSPLGNEQPKHNHQRHKEEESRQKLLIRVLWCPWGRYRVEQHVVVIWYPSTVWNVTINLILLIVQKHNLGSKTLNIMCKTCVLLWKTQLPGGGLPSLMLKAVAKMPNGKAPIPNDIWNPPSPNPKPWKPYKTMIQH